MNLHTLHVIINVIAEEMRRCRIVSHLLIRVGRIVYDWAERYHKLKINGFLLKLIYSHACDCIGETD
jgi:hypothetical protein